MIKKEVLASSATLIGMTIGAGILGIPYVISRAGFITGLITIILLGFVSLYINLCVGEIALRTKGNHQLAGYAEKYLGKQGKYIIWSLLILFSYGALSAYILGSGTTFAALFGGSPKIYEILFLAVFGAIIYFNIKIYEDSEALLTFILVMTVLVIILFASPFVKASNLKGFDIGSLFIPFGVVLFAYTGVSAVPQLKEELKNKKLLKKAIVTGTSVCGIIYTLFAAVTVGVVGKDATPVITIALGRIIGGWFNYLINIFSIISMATSFVAVGYVVRELYNLDLGVSRKVSWFMVVIIPLVIVLFNLSSFINLLNYSGAILISMIMIMILFIYHNARKKGERKPEYSLPYHPVISVVIGLIFLIGMLTVIFHI